MQMSLCSMMLMFLDLLAPLLLMLYRLCLPSQGQASRDETGLTNATNWKQDKILGFKGLHSLRAKEQPWINVRANVCQIVPYRSSCHNEDEVSTAKRRVGRRRTAVLLANGVTSHPTQHQKASSSKETVDKMCPETTRSTHAR